ncbi:hypothetical protein EYF80_026142 [Liparis tanakae]|uniref:Uncharacterized protein n=1 Tax=Liparis tanakae TaxID=230148 RepID=A0A4Z2HCW6_9TELE|nr:hypothetical protein EYF80_026142 [Liparis tanakae]
MALRLCVFMACTDDTSTPRTHTHTNRTHMLRAVLSGRGRGRAASTQAELQREEAVFYGRLRVTAHGKPHAQTNAGQIQRWPTCFWDTRPSMSVYTALVFSEDVARLRSLGGVFQSDVSVDVLQQNIHPSLRHAAPKREDRRKEKRVSAAAFPQDLKSMAKWARPSRPPPRRLPERNHGDIKRQYRELKNSLNKLPAEAVSCSGVGGRPSGSANDRRGSQCVRSSGSGTKSIARRFQEEIVGIQP